jgi:hypothetical protein
MMKASDYIMSNQKEVLEFLKSRFPMFHLSNFFFRDVQYGITMMLEEKGMRVRYSEAEKIARAFVEKLEHARIFKPIDRQSWVLNHPEFKTPASKPSAPAKLAAGAPAAQRPAGVPAKPGPDQSAKIGVVPDTLQSGSGM